MTMMSGGVGGAPRRRADRHCARKQVGIVEEMERASDVRKAGAAGGGAAGGRRICHRALRRVTSLPPPMAPRSPSC